MIDRIRTRRGTTLSDTSRIAWLSGELARTQHLQHMDQCHEKRLWSALCSTHAYPWGLIHVDVANHGKEMDDIELTAIEAILPDGTTLVAPGDDDVPSPISLSSVPSTTSSVVVWLSLPPWRRDGVNCAMPPGNGVRFSPFATDLPDLFGSQAPTRASVLRAQPRLSLSSDGARDAYAAPILRLVRSATGRFRIDDTFMAPSVNARHCAALNLRMKHLDEAIHGRITALTGGQSENVRAAVAFRAGDSATFWLLQALNSATATTKHLFTLPVVAPERVFQELLRLAGSLLAFSRTERHAELPCYSHLETDGAFTKLFDKIHSLIGTVIPTRFTAVPFTKERPSHFGVNLEAGLVSEGRSFFLAVGSSQPAHDLAPVVPTRFKVGAPADVTKAIASALRCVPLTHIAQPPASLPVRPGQLYFAMDSRDPAFANMIETGAAAAFVPAGFDDVTLELLIVND